MRSSFFVLAATVLACGGGTPTGNGGGTGSEPQPQLSGQYEMTQVDASTTENRRVRIAEWRCSFGTHPDGSQTAHISGANLSADGSEYEGDFSWGTRLRTADGREIRGTDTRGPLGGTWSVDGDSIRFSGGTLDRAEISATNDAGRVVRFNAPLALTFDRDECENTASDTTVQVNTRWEG